MKMRKEILNGSKWFDRHYAPESILADEIGETEDSKNRASSRVGQ